jgi:phosphoribosylaminoimidazolecarboxamide formyltransferase / IMP cyclohydrolase
VIKVKRALLSVYDKTGIVDFARALVDLGVEIVSSGGTASALADAGIDVIPVEQLTGQPEIFGGRVKTLTPQIHGGLLMRRDHTGDVEQAAKHAIKTIDLLCVNLYPFQDTVAAKGDDRDACIEMIDIGGPAMIRAAAKNHRHVIVATQPVDYSGIIETLRENNSAYPEEAAALLATEAYGLTCAYDGAIVGYLGAGEEMKRFWGTGGEKLQDLRYGENPNQQAACYVSGNTFWRGLTKHQGKKISYNNMGDLWSGWRCLGEFDDCASVIIKHSTPCGVASGETPEKAFIAARDGDSLSAFGGVVLLNRPGDEAVARLLVDMFLEIVAAPSWSDEALKILKKKKNLRVLTLPSRCASEGEGWSFRSLGEAIVLQTCMPAFTGTESWRCVTETTADAKLLGELAFSWRVCRHVRSNAIVLTRDQRTLGLGGGQTSRIDAMDIAILKAQRCEHDLKGAVLSSDAFFPFRDVVDRAVAMGVIAVVQPGGSRQDQQSIDACNEGGIPMYFTDERVFMH